MTDSLCNTDPTLLHLGPRTPHHMAGQEFILASTPLHDAVIGCHQMLSIAQLTEAVIALHERNGAVLPDDADLRSYVKYTKRGMYQMTDARNHVFFIQYHPNLGWQVQLNNHHWYPPQQLTGTAA